MGAVEPSFSFWAVQRPTEVSWGATGLASILEALPDQETCLQLFKAFCHPLIPVVNMTTFESLYQQFWRWRSSWDGHHVFQGVLAENHSFLPLLIAVLFTGAITLRKPIGDNTSPSDIAMKLRDMVPKALPLSASPLTRPCPRSWHSSCSTRC